MNLELLDKAVRRVPDFPKPGVLFYDITGVLVNPDAFKFVLEKMYDIYKDSHFDAVAAHNATATSLRHIELFMFNAFVYYFTARRRSFTSSIVSCT